MDNITVEEKKVVDELRRRTINDLSPKTLEDDTVFYRFAKARDFNLVEAEAMLRKHIAWRKEFQIDTLLTDYEEPEIIRKYLPSTFVCFDKEGGTVRLQDWGRADTKGLCNCTDKTEVAKSWFLIAEQDKEMIIKRGGNIAKPIFYVIYDLDEMTYANATHLKTIQCLIYGVKLLLDNYPECVKVINVINAPFFFPWCFAVLKAILPSSVAEKMRVFGTVGWKEALLKDIDPDNLPAYLGGFKTDPDGNPLCKTFIRRGKPIPKSYYKHNGNNTKKQFKPDDTEKLTVKPFGKEEITFEIKEGNLYLEWEIEIKNRDIDFSLIYRNCCENLESEELIPKQRIDSSLESEKGCLKCEKLGKYTFLFDNSFSWLHSKEIFYKVRIRNNDDLHKSTGREFSD